MNIKTRIIVLFLILIVLVSCAPQGKKSQTALSHSSELSTPYEAKQALKSLTCGDGYIISYSPIDTEHLYVEVTKDHLSAKHKMTQVRSASGAKYQTADGRFCLWSHHGDFTYYKDDKVICSYIAPVKKATTSSGALYTVSYQSGEIMEIEVDNSTSASLNDVSLSSKDFGEEISIKMTTDPITAVFLADLDNNENEELYLITTSAGSGSYGEVYAFIPEKELKTLQCVLPEISTKEIRPSAAFEGYRGHDTFYIENSFLVREFPIYQAQDAHSNPTGGTQKLFYTLQDNKFKRLSKKEN